MKLCGSCNQFKSLDAFYPAKNRGGIVRTPCVECSRRKGREWAARNKEKRAARKSLDRYGVTAEELEQLTKNQMGVCKICGLPEQSKSKSRLSIDHDHETGIVRGLLCSSCNHGLGHFRDSPELLRAAAEYLEVKLNERS